MKKNILFGLLIWFLSSACYVQAAHYKHINSASSADEEIKSSLRAHIEFLAHDNLKGRDTGSVEYEIAAQYIASHFKQFGLAPGGEDNGWFQSVPFVKSTLNESSVKMQIHRGSHKIELKYPQQFVVLPSAVSGEDKVRSRLVFAGFGIDSKVLKHNDYAGLNVQGKIVVILAGSPKTFSGEIGAHVGDLRLKLSHAEQRGAAGVIILQTPQQERVKSYKNMVSFVKKPFLNWKTKEGKVFDGYVNLRGKAYLNISSSKALFSAAGFDLERIYSAIEAGKAPLGFDMNIEVSLERKTDHSTVHSSNIVGVLEGSDPVLKNEYLVYSAHLDHLGVNTGQENAINNGALDNASGIAILLESARQLSLVEKPKRSILFIAVTAEEKGLLGSNYFAHHPTVPKSSIVANINLDMPLILYPFADMIAFGAQHSTLKSYVESSAQANNLKLIPDPMPEQALFVRSDHYSFVKQGIPAIYLMPGLTSTDPTINGAKLLGEFISKHYHQPTDDLSLPIHYGAGVTFTKVNVDVGEKIANSSERPSWHDGSFFGETFGK